MEHNESWNGVRWKRKKREKGPMPKLSKNIYLCTQEPNCNKQIHEGANLVLQDIIHKDGHIFWHKCCWVNSWPQDEHGTHCTKDELNEIVCVEL